MNANSETSARLSDEMAMAFRPRLSFYHPNARGTGCAMQLEVIPAYGCMEGCIMMRLANQLTIGDRRGPNPVYPTFDWENKIVVKLGFLDIASILQVFRGECETILEGKGLYHRTARYSTRITLRHVIETIPGYCIDVYRNARGTEDQHAGIMLSPTEAMGLSIAIEDSLGVISFGIPMISESERQAELAVRMEQAKVTGSRNVRAA